MDQNQINEFAVKLGTTPERIKEELLFSQQDKELGEHLESLYDDESDYYDSTEEFLLEPFELTRVSKRRS